MRDDRQRNVLSGQVTILAGHCPLTDCYFEPSSLCCILYHNALYCAVRNSYDGVLLSTSPDHLKNVSIPANISEQFRSNTFEDFRRLKIRNF